LRDLTTVNHALSLPSRGCVEEDMVVAFEDALNPGVNDASSASSRRLDFEAQEEGDAGNKHVSHQNHEISHDDGA